MKHLFTITALFIASLCASAQDLNISSATTDTLWIDNGSRHIFGIVSKPQYQGRKQPVAIISHGFNGSHNFGQSYFKPLNEMGYQVYVFDFPCGSTKSLSDNNTMNMSVLDEVNDLKAVTEYFRSQPDVDADG